MGKEDMSVGQVKWRLGRPGHVEQQQKRRFGSVRFKRATIKSQTSPSSIRLLFAAPT